jgi:hypothetical protein
MNTPTPDDFRKWWRETGSASPGPSPEMLLNANAWAEHWAARCLQAQPEPVGVIDDELLRTYGIARRDYCYEGPSDDWPKRAERAATIHGLRAVLARYARPAIQTVAPESGYEKGYAQEHLARLMRDAIGTETNHNVYIVAAGKILDRPEFMHVARYYRPTIEPVS